MHTEEGKAFNPNKGFETGERKAWNTGLSKETDERVRKNAEACSNTMSSEDYVLHGRYAKSYYNSEEHKLASSKGGLKSATSQNRRSKNEILFSELCSSKFNIKCNESIFNGWDADVIIESLKVAILWNGPWHYKKCNAKHSLEQVQSRDKIKTKEIIDFGYIPYIIKDMGGYNKKFVEEQFNIFLEWCKGSTPVL